VGDASLALPKQAAEGFISIKQILPVGDAALASPKQAAEGFYP